MTSMIAPAAFSSIEYLPTESEPVIQKMIFKCLYHSCSRNYMIKHRESNQVCNKLISDSWYDDLWGASVVIWSLLMPQTHETLLGYILVKLLYSLNKVSICNIYRRIKIWSCVFVRFVSLSLPPGPRGPSQVCRSSWRLRMESWSSRGLTSADTTACTSTATAACLCGRRRWSWTARTREIQSGSERRRPRWEEAVARSVLSCRASAFNHNVTWLTETLLEVQSVMYLNVRV